tara:strand:- start:993 stop:1880 length:888 start_codon:yes stop_codon:yes gene_type:complete
MKISIIVPTYNNLSYLKLFIKSIEENSKYLNEVIVHINDGSDGTLDYVKNKNIKFTHSKNNIGLCSSVNLATKLSSNDLIVYAHDDMFFCKNWDYELLHEIKTMKSNLYYISGMNISYLDGFINHDCGNTVDNFDRKKFEVFCETNVPINYQGSHWAPHIVHKNLWNAVGGFSEEFNPGDGSDPDFCFKLWKKNVRIFKTFGKWKVYHFGSVTTRKKKYLKINKGTKKFILKWKMRPRTFRTHYLRGEKKIEYKEPLDDPKLSMLYIKDIFIDRLKYIYFKLINKFKKFNEYLLH